MSAEQAWPKRPDGPHRHRKGPVARSRERPHGTRPFQNVVEVHLPYAPTSPDKNPYSPTSREGTGQAHAKFPLSWFCKGQAQSCKIPSVLFLHWLCMKKAPEGARKSNGGPAGVRTLDLGIKSPLLYQLSYRSTYQETVGWVQGLEPWTSGTTTRRSSQLGYTHRVSSRQSA